MHTHTHTRMHTHIHTEDHELVGSIAAQSSELTALTLLLLAERAKGPGSVHSALLASLPVSVLSSNVGWCVSSYSI